MIEAVLVANSFREASEVIDQRHVRNELRVDIAERSRRVRDDQ
jgi:hypothetical protein